MIGLNKFRFTHAGTWRKLGPGTNGSTCLELAPAMRVRIDPPILSQAVSKSWGSRRRARLFISKDQDWPKFLEKEVRKSSEFIQRDGSVSLVVERRY